MPKDARGKNRKWGSHKDRQFEQVNEGELIEQLKNKENDEQEEIEEQEEEEVEQQPQKVEKTEEEQQQQPEKKKKKKKRVNADGAPLPKKQKRNLDLPSSDEEDESQYY